MQARWLGRVCLGLAAVLAVASAARADVRLPRVFGEHMVLQQELPVPVWGWADPGEKVTVSVAGQSKTATADAGGKWSLKLDPLATGGPHSFKVQGKNCLVLADVLVGEVWLCSGQSNMAMTVGGSANKDAEAAAANYPRIRMLQVDRVTAEEPQTDVKASWVVCSPKTVAGFSAAGYFFGRELHKQLGRPVGLLHSSWGGTPIQAWTSVKAHESVPQLAPMIPALAKAIASYNPERAQQQYEKQREAFKKAAAKAKAEGQPFKGRPPRPPIHPRVSQGSPGRLYNGMIAPLAPYALRGAIWYQGEANAGIPAAGILYGLQLKTMVADWRSAWGEGDFAFLSVQLPNFMAPQQKPSETGGWPLIREQFLKSLKTIPNSGIAVTIDIGDAENIHPTNKQEAGRRLALWALGKVYDRKLVASGPLFRCAAKQGDRMIVEFDEADGGLAVRGGGALKGFAIAGADHQFVWADAKIEAGRLIVSSPQVISPQSVRYAWANNPECNLINTAGLPASPFRTDNWAE